MSLEILGAWVAKLGWVIFIPYLAWLYRKDKTKLDNTITKKETGELIDLKIAPLEQKIEMQNASLNDKFDLMVSLVKAESLESKIQRDEAKKQVKENTSLLCDIKTDVAVLKKEMEYTSRV
tara:strand:+ start:8938 stop:9300 length:363 start_codon:yes stop_codon:yes gene_type:complete